MLLEMISTLSAGVFAGAAVYINLVEHPARVGCGTEVGVKEFGVSYRRGAVLMASLLMIGFASAVGAWARGSGGWWLIGGSLLLLPVPYTLAFVMPVNKSLLNCTLPKDSGLASRLLVRWGRLHAVRSLLGLAAFLIFIFVLARRIPA